MNLLPAQLDAQLVKALSDELGRVVDDERAAAGLDSWWTFNLGAESTAAAAKANAAAGRRLYEVHVRKAAAVRESGDLAALRQLMTDVGAVLVVPSTTQATARQLAPTTAVVQVVGGTAKDAAKLVGGTVADAGGVVVWLLRHVKLVLAVGAVLAVLVAWRQVRSLIPWGRA